ncbi:hypothetical protein CcrBL47_gp505 [Caulobacter phage BL47]|nr:hypothetical protein CcrBL47_gp505 [Caulobacter phage BL47]UTU10344.1 hypothetical protein CcrRB23_gp482 [Caulobacter phage RB23]
MIEIVFAAGVALVLVIAIFRVVDHYDGQ